MFSPRYLPGLLVAVLACSDSPTSTSTFAGPYEEPNDGFQTISGYLVSTTELLVNDGNTVPLMGPQTELLSELVGAEIRIRGTADEFAPALWIVEFRVLAVDDLPALDGRLTEIGGGFAITQDEDYTMIGEVPEDLAPHVGKRVWLTLRNGAPVRYGVLEM